MYTRQYKYFITSQIRENKIVGVYNTQTQAIQIFDMTIKSSFWFTKSSKKLNDDILLWWYSVQYDMGKFSACIFTRW